MIINIKKLDEKAVIPTYAHDSDAGLDITAVSASMEVNPDGTATFIYKCGIAIEIPEGYVGLLFPRSSISGYSLNQTNSVGVIDSGYRGEVMVKFKLNTTSVPRLYNPGERVAQLIIMPYPKVIFNEVDELSETDRGTNGYGSTNKESMDSDKNQDLGGDDSVKQES